MKLSIQNADWWNERGIRLPAYDVEKIRTATAQQPEWIHFGAGNLFRAYIARIAQKMLNAGKCRTGVIAVDTSSDASLMQRVYLAHDLLSLSVTLHADGCAEREVIGSVAQILYKGEYDRLKEIFCAPSLQTVSLTITEKGYTPEGIPGLLAKLLKERFLAGGASIALVSMDNCSQNGEKLRSAVLAASAQDGDFLDYLNTKVSFPWTMIDKITPQPDARVCEALRALGLEDMEILPRTHGAAIAPFVNAESAEYLVVEDNFPNGRMLFETAGVVMTDRKNVDFCEKMKVSACLNPLHTAMAVLGCTLGYARIYEEMRDQDIVDLICRIGKEGIWFMEKSGVLNPREFLNDVIVNRLPNPYIPDSPQRIACDTSQKVPIRYGNTIRMWSAYGAEGRLTGVALAIAGWLRYLLGLDDRLQPFTLSSDPRLEELQAHLGDVEIGKYLPVKALVPILSDLTLFPMDLSASPLGEKILRYFNEMCAGKGAVRACIQKHLEEE